MRWVLCSLRFLTGRDWNLQIVNIIKTDHVVKYMYGCFGAVVFRLTNREYDHGLTQYPRWDTFLFCANMKGAWHGTTRNSMDT